MIIPFERSTKPQLKNAIFGQNYRFWSSLYRFNIVLQCFTVYPGTIIWFPLQNGCGKTFYTTSASAACLTALCVLLQRSNCMTWYDTCQCNCKSQLHRPVSSSGTSFEFSLLEEARMSSHSDILQAFHCLASVSVAKSNRRHGPMPWLSSSSKKIVKPQLSVRWQLSRKSAHVCTPAKSMIMRSSENTECSRAPWTAATSPRPAGAVLRSACPRWTEMD